MKTAIDLHALMAAIGDGIVVCDRAGLITLWNPGAERMFGFSEAEALGASLDIIIPEKQRKRHWEGYHHTMATGITKYGHDVLRVPAIGKDGRQLSIAFSVALLVGPDGEVSGIASVMRDETREFLKNKELRRRLNQLEAQAGRAAQASGETSTTEQPEQGCPVHKA